MSALIERLRAALGAEYDVERELAAGGMGVVFLGRERALDRAVAIKILRPELATAVAAERFQREARLLAAVNHPNVVTIHRVGEAGGLFYLVMERLEGTLAERIARGPLPAAEVVRLAREVLEGLARVHERGIVHRDIKPSNIFLRDGGRAVLGDFGIARSLTSGDGALTATGVSPGTPAYMAPEQFVTTDVRPAADLYALGMVCYEALTGRRWAGTDPVAGDWRGVPSRLRAVLQRVLALEPTARWPDAPAFARALAASGRPGRGVWVVAGTAAGAMVVALLLLPRGPETPPAASEVAVLPLVVQSGHRDVGEMLAIGIEAHLTRAFGDSGVRVTPVALTRPWAEHHGDVFGPVPAEAWDELRTRGLVRGRAIVTGDSMAVEAELVGRDGTVQQLAPVTGALGDQDGVSHRMALAVVRAVRPEGVSAFTGMRTGGNVAAVEALVAAEHAFQHDNWAAAEAFYERAIGLDSSLALAQWGRYNVRRWRRATTGADVAALAAMYARHKDSFVGLDRLLIEADLAPTVPERLAAYRAAITQFPYDPYPRLLLGNELFHRGAFADEGLDRAVVALRAAAAANPYQASTYSMLSWALTRLGNRAEAKDALDAHATIARAQPEGDFCMGCVLELAWVERFLPLADAARARTQVLTSPDGPSSLVRAVRLGLSFGLPHAQYAIGEQLATLPDVGMRAIGLTAQALALLAEGRVAAALERLDDAGRVTGDPEFAFEAAQWRVILPALGVPGVGEPARAAGRSRVATERDSARAGRAQWTLLLDALARGAPEADAHRQALDTAPGSAGLRALGEALALASRGDTARAIALTDSLRHHVLAAAVEDPLERAVLFLRRGDWLAGRHSEAADAAWRWYENADLAGWPDGYPQAAELDWALETFARYQRARLARTSRDPAAACRILPDVSTRWMGADPQYQPLRDEVSAWMAACDRS
jgi:tRNA A-37 threonylcarbamoyl transferase component Bud32